MRKEIKTWQERQHSYKSKWYQLPPSNVYFMKQEILELRAAVASEDGSLSVETPPKFYPYNPDGLENMGNRADLWEYGQLVGWRLAQTNYTENKSNEISYKNGYKGLVFAMQIIAKAKDSGIDPYKFAELSLSFLGSDIYDDKINFLIDELSKNVTKLESNVDQVMKERDYNEAFADELASAIANYFNEPIGEHSSANCPWTNAANLINEKKHIEHKNALEMKTAILKVINSGSHLHPEAPSAKWAKQLVDSIEQDKTVRKLGD